MRSGNPYQLGWFATGRDEAARDLLTVVNNSIRQGEIKARIAFVFCNREPGETEESDLFIRLVKSDNIPLVCFSYEKFRAAQSAAPPHAAGTLPAWRRAYDREVMSRLRDFRADLCVLAGYMLIVGRQMCRRYDMINLHPAAPGGPTGTWQEVIWQLMANEAQESGVMMHLVTPELDRGPAVAYGTFSLQGEAFDQYWREMAGHTVAELRQKTGENHPLFQRIRRHGLAREFPLIIATLKAFSQGRIRITADKKVVDSEGKPIIGYNLTDEIDEQIKEILP